MSLTPELEHLTILAEIDDLVLRVRRWLDHSPAWDPAHKARSVVRKIVERVSTLRIRLESPIVVATFGGTGTGKSTLVNALVGQEVSQSGRQRPTTTMPILLVHPDFETNALGLDLSQFQVKKIDTPMLRDLVIIDCPDPDTSEGADSGSNLARLRAILPHCDVLLYVSTQQKYRSARISEELADAAAGCRLVFVQTHADQDSDIRDDWKQNLAPAYQVPDMFFVDSRRAMREQAQGQRSSGDFGRLIDLLTNQLGASRRVAIRRANLIDLLEEALTLCRLDYDKRLKDVRSLQDILEQQRTKLRDSLTTQLRDELLLNRNLWERRLLAAVTDIWGFSPFSSVLRFYNGLGAFIASFSFFRARSSAQMALIGAMQGARWVKSKVEENDADSTLERLASFGIADQHLQEARMVVSGYVHSAGIQTEDFSDRRDLSQLRRRAAQVEGQFLGDARRAIDQLIDELAEQHCTKLIQYRYEGLFLLYVAFLIGRVGYNFFWSSFLAPILGARSEAEPLLAVDFYIPAVLFLVLWSGLLVMIFIWNLRQGLSERIHQLAQSMVETRISEGLFPALEAACHEIAQEDRSLTELLEQTSRFRRHLAESTAFLGSQRRT
ncbi:MAG: GTPase domain-containing protein [Planctomycetales bacterium]|jgi:ABC-type multidrug transport system fused ATPase/permease subunit|nr:GTPase domain-containing protein [Planctomycetales bacterium]